jgi:uncharacterized protein (DUF1684 family)
MSEDIGGESPLTEPSLLPNVCVSEPHYQQPLAVQPLRLTMLLIGLFLPPGPGYAQDTESPGATSPEASISLIEQGRAAKDSFLADDPESPLTEEMKSRFDGLQYFPVDLTYRVVADFHAYGRPRSIPVPTNRESVMQMERFGRIVGTCAGNPFSLEVFRSKEDGSNLVLFRDGTSGTESYSAGRYVRVADAGEGTYVIDFNNSYNPYCAYNSDYVCPLPPAENTLSFAVRAGEKDSGANLAH